ncbi:MAG: hypothetical protein MUF61_02315, partial [archaeon]|nr:hypothetical protein [archaeon]
GHEKKALEMFRDIAIRYLAGHEEKDENGKKKKEEKNAYQNWRAIWDGFGDLKDAANKAYSPRLEERLGSRARGMALVEEWLPDVASDPEFNAKAPQNVLDDFYLAGINFLDQKYRGNIQNNWTDILSSLPKDGLASVVLDHLPPVQGTKRRLLKCSEISQ